MSVFRIKSKVSVNIYLALLLYLTSALLILFMGRFIFFWLNSSYFPGLTFNRWINILKGGVRFDLAAILYTNSLFILLLILPLPFRYKSGYQKAAKIVFIVTNGLALLLNCIDFIYFKFTLRRSTMDVFSEFAREKSKASFLLTFLLDYWYMILIYAVCVFLLVMIYNRICIKKPASLSPWLRYPIGVILAILIVIGVIGGIRGDFRHSTRPITMSNAGEYVTMPGEIPLVLNTPFCLIRTIRQTFYRKENFFPEEQIENVYTPSQKLSSEKPFLFDNVVVIILESFGKEGVGYYNKDLQQGTYKGYTPFLDSLLSVSRVSNYSFANGRKSIDALPAVLAGIPAGALPFVLTPYDADRIRSLPAILKEKGYQTSFFHGAANGSMGFKAFVNLMGIDYYFGRDEYNHDADFDGLWGIWDEPFFQFFARNLDTIQQPFFSTIFSISSHHPFKVPKQYEGLFPKGTLPIHQCMGYTDMALRKFFETSGKMKWFNHTLFVITADHATISNFPEYQTAIGNMAVPIAFYHPGYSLPPIDNTISQQTDIMPSILTYLNYTGPVTSFGKSLFTKGGDHFVVNYNNGFQLTEDRYFLQFDGQKTTGLFDFVNDRLLINNLKNILPVRRDSMENRLKAFIQQYHNRLIEDRLQ